MGTKMIQIEVNQRVGIVATPGAGKSNAAYTLLEDLRTRRYPVCILDVKNEYGGLPKTPIVYASQTNAAKLANVLKETSSSCAVFMKDMSLKKKQKWISKFLLECHKVKRDIPIMIVIEELRLFAPQKKHPVSKEPIEDLAQGGRSEGYGCLLVSQRCANVEKDVLGSLTDLFIMQHTIKQDKEYLGEFIGKDRAEKLPKFQKGQAFHLNFATGGEITEVQFPFNPNKKGGDTVQPTPVDPQPLEIKGKKKKEKHESDAKWMVIGGIIAIVTVIITVILVIYLYLNREEGENAADHD